GDGTRQVLAEAQYMRVVHAGELLELGEVEVPGSQPIPHRVVEPGMVLKCRSNLRDGLQFLCRERQARGCRQVPVRTYHRLVPSWRVAVKGIDVFLNGLGAALAS